MPKTPAPRILMKEECPVCGRVGQSAADHHDHLTDWAHKYAASKLKNPDVQRVIGQARYRDYDSKIKSTCFKTRTVCETCNTKEGNLKQRTHLKKKIVPDVHFSFPVEDMKEFLSLDSVGVRTNERVASELYNERLSAFEDRRAILKAKIDAILWEHLISVNPLLI